jgi:hypothetical protein
MGTSENKPIYDLFKDTGLTKAQLLEKGFHCSKNGIGEYVHLQTLANSSDEQFMRYNGSLPELNRRGHALYDTNKDGRVFIAAGDKTYELDLKKAKELLKSHDEKFVQAGFGNKPELFISFNQFGSFSVPNAIAINFYDTLNNQALKESGKNFIHSHEIGHHTEENKLIFQNAVKEKVQNPEKYLSLLRDLELNADITGATLSSPQGALNSFNSTLNIRSEKITKTLLDDKTAAGKSNPDNVTAREFGKDMEHYGVQVMARLIASKTNLVDVKPGAFESPDSTTGVRDVKHPTLEQRVENIENHFSLSNAKTGQLKPSSSPVEIETDPRSKN